MKKYEKVAEDFQRARDRGLYSVILLDRETGEVWTKDYVSTNDWTERSDDRIKDITVNVIGMREMFWRAEGAAPNLADMIREVVSAERSIVV